MAKPRLDVVEAIDLIRGAGGVAALAHPPYNLRVETLRTLAAAGLGAVEVAGPGISNRLGRRFRDWAAELNLVPVAGSDFHTRRPTRPLGGCDHHILGQISTVSAGLALRIHLRRAHPNR